MKIFFYCSLLFLVTLTACQKQITANLDQPFLSADKSTLPLPGTKTSVDSFTIQSNIGWTITIVPSSADWLQTSKTTGSGNNKIYVTTLKDNAGDNILHATIVITPVNTPFLAALQIPVTQEKL
jgi:curli biogenesis system outer membrane secretion channel CsgG